MSDDLSAGGIEIAVTGTAWMGGGVGSVQSAIERLLQAAKNEVQIAVYEITEGAEDFLNRLRICLARGIQVTLVINKFDDRPLPVKHRLADLSRRFPHLKLLDFQPESNLEDLHAKIIVVDRRKALVGSANLTWKGLVGNHELALVVSGPIAYTIASLLDKLCEDTRTSQVGIKGER